LCQLKVGKQDEVAMLGKAEKQVNVEGIAMEGGKIQPPPLECPAAR